MRADKGDRVFAAGEEQSVAPPHILIDRRESVTWVTLNRPARANALTLAMMAQLWQVWVDFDHDPEQRVLVLCAAGKNFCGGRDLRELATASTDDDRLLRELRPAGAPANWFYRLLPPVSKPTVVAVNGAAVGGGWALVQRCELRIAATSASFRINEIEHGLGAGNFLVELARELPTALVTELVQLGEPFGARRAYEIGLVNRVVEPDQLETTVASVAGRLAGFSSAALRANKEAIQHSRFPDHAVQWAYAQQLFDRLRRR